ncbi:MAG: DUF2474 domain-containing protein [Pseudomonadota bacterium]|nr:DUF2474 domain-containing protein [Pseudomonadota bacterium]
MSEKPIPPWRRATWTISLAVAVLVALALVAGLAREWLS